MQETVMLVIQSGKWVRNLVAQSQFLLAAVQIVQFISYLVVK